MKKHISLLVISALFLSSCQDNFLSLVPETELSSGVYYKTEQDFTQAVNGAYVPLRTIYNDPAWKLGELHSDNTHYARNTLFGAVDNTENLADFALPVSMGKENVKITTNVPVLAHYRQNFQIVARVNEILVRIDGADFNAEAKANLKGQALFLRAFAYFDLARYFGKAPLHLVPVTNRDEAAAPLADQPALFAQVEKDLKEAIPLLPLKSKQQAGRITSGAAGTLLANLYIVQKKWKEAETLLRTIVSSNEYALMPNYDDAFSQTSSNKNNKESVFEIQYKEGSEGLNGSYIYQVIPAPIRASELAPITGTSNPQDISGENNNIPTPDLIAAYEPNDQRKDISIGYVTLSQSLRADKVYPYIKKFARKHAIHGNTGQNWPVYRYAEVLLFLAEALAEQGQSAEAASFLNQVRSRAGLPPVNVSGANLVELVHKERRVELAFENKRWLDLVRTGKAKEVITEFGKRVIADPNAYYFPSGAIPPNNAFTVIEDFYPLPADESALTPHF